MSLILDALNRSRQEQQSSVVPGLDTLPVVPVAERRSYSVLFWLVLLTVCMAIVFGLWWSRPEPRLRASASLPPPETRSPAHVEQQVPDTNRQNQVPAVRGQGRDVATTLRLTDGPSGVHETSGRSTRRATSRADVAAVQDLYRRQADGTDAPAMKSQAKTGNVLLASPASTASVLRPGPSQRSEERVGDDVDVGQMLSLAKRELARVELSEHASPLLADTPQRFKDLIPTLYYSQHDYSTQETRSTVVLNGEPYRAGDLVAPGLSLSEILPDAVVLEYDGTSFRLRALNSWVNL